MNDIETPFADQADLIDRAGRALFGDQYRPQLAEALRADIRELRRWTAGYREIPPEIFVCVLTLVQRRARTLADLSQELYQAMRPPDA